MSHDKSEVHKNVNSMSVFMLKKEEILKKKKNGTERMRMQEQAEEMGGWIYTFCTVLTFRPCYNFAYSKTKSTEMEKGGLKVQTETNESSYISNE